MLLSVNNQMFYDELREFINNFETISWRLPSLTVLNPTIFNKELTHLGSEASDNYTITTCTEYILKNKRY